MFYLVVKAALSGMIILMVSEISKRSPSLGGLIASLPLISVLGIIWLWRETNDVERVATHAESTFWFVLPTLPMFLLLPFLLRHGVSFWVSLACVCLVTMVLYAATVWILLKFGIKL